MGAASIDITIVAPSLASFMHSLDEHASTNASSPTSSHNQHPLTPHFFPSSDEVLAATSEATMAGIALGAFSVAQIVSVPLAARLADYNLHLALRLGLALLVVANVLYSRATSTWTVIASRLIAGFAAGIHAIPFSYFARALPSNQAKATSLLRGAGAMAVVVAPAIAGIFTTFQYKYLTSGGVVIIELNEYRSPGYAMALVFMILLLSESALVIAPSVSSASASYAELLLNKSAEATVVAVVTAAATTDGTNAVVDVAINDDTRERQQPNERRWQQQQQQVQVQSFRDVEHATRLKRQTWLCTCINLVTQYSIMALLTWNAPVLQAYPWFMSISTTTIVFLGMGLSEVIALALVYRKLSSPSSLRESSPLLQDDGSAANDASTAQTKHASMMKVALGIQAASLILFVRFPLGNFELMVVAPCLYVIGAALHAAAAAAVTTFTNSVFNMGFGPVGPTATQSAPFYMSYSIAGALSPPITGAVLDQCGLNIVVLLSFALVACAFVASRFSTLYVRHHSHTNLV